MSSFAESWISFLKKHKGQGYTKTELSELYQKSKGKSKAKKKVVKKAPKSKPPAAKKPPPPDRISAKGYVHGISVFKTAKDNLVDYEMAYYSNRKAANTLFKEATGRDLKEGKEDSGPLKGLPKGSWIFYKSHRIEDV